MELIKEYIYLIRNQNVFSSNTYILKNKINNKSIIIDPGFDFEAIDKLITDNRLVPVAIISTHGHFDHIAGVSFFKNKFNIPFYLHEADLKLSQSANFYLKVAKINYKIETPLPDFLFKSQFENLFIEGFDFRIYNLPGHSMGSCILKNENYLFSGDIIYKKGLGPESIPREDKLALKKSILNIFDTFDDNDLILPGHGFSEYLGIIKNNNLELQNFIANTANANA